MKNLLMDFALTEKGKIWQIWFPQDRPGVDVIKQIFAVIKDHMSVIKLAKYLSYGQMIVATAILL